MKFFLYLSGRFKIQVAGKKTGERLSEVIKEQEVLKLKYLWRNTARKSVAQKKKLFLQSQLIN